MTDMAPARPEPIGDVRAGRYYDTIEVAAYRMAQGVSQVELARSLGTTQTAVSIMETSAHPEAIPAWDVVRVLDSIDRLAKTRRAMQVSGLHNLAAIRGDAATTALYAEAAREHAETKRQRANEANRENAKRLVVDPDTGETVMLGTLRARRRARRDKAVAGAAR